MSAPQIMKRPALARIDVLAGLAAVAILLALAAAPESAQARGAGAAASRAPHVQTLTRRCDPPPCPARVVR